MKKNELEKIVEGNVVIAEFMGIPIDDIKEFMKTKYAKKFCYNPRYHSSFDWIMPVMEKIQNFSYNGYSASYEITSRECEIKVNSCGYDHPIEKFNFSGKKTNEVVWEAAIEFIKWFNEIKKTEL